ncbi:hypothetical protein AB0N73_10845 [Microbacterium sp. NPDC089189]|uniref:hypothetical protein n=1 Tax=Microbacterium sp. NPDC089189 TaxID=3154972 RepID=UPI003424234E
MNRDRIIGIVLAVVGLILATLFVIWDLNGAPSWLHYVSWISGGLSGYGLVLALGSSRTRR